ncbi:MULTISPECIES: SDR family oxidoreductase [Amycolatopsis]|uniref:NADP-dependent 3-hydroxy acid dehydrogenase YdfG n=2 Tax=Amycolatopsis TaxID=1813 RepID=A0A1I3X423_9PSEU|nr:SDR family oxidoreductase [Amycolatopsis sacchari]SFK13576.1 NADP-dependent 3-hydroxy acid dehydrogenase YdfG [Amycolatopsis sacchari]
MTERAPKTVLVTGSSSGFGKAAVTAFLAQGWRVAATARRPDAEQDTENLFTCRLDLHDPDSIESAVAATVERFGTLDCVVNNAGAGLLSVFETTPMETVRELFETNVFGAMRVIQAALPRFADQGGGRIVNVSSTAGLVPEPFMSVYAATKSAVEALTEGLRYELAARDVVVKLVEPGLVRDTNFVQATAEASLALPVPDAYRAAVDKVIAGYQAEYPHRLATEAEVADAIVAAATDSGTRLRYLVGEDSEAAAHMRWSTSEEQYNAWALERYSIHS